MALKEPNQNNPRKISNLNRLTNYLSFVFVVPLVLHFRRKKQISQMVTKINQANNSLNKKLSKRRELLLELVDSTKQSIRWDRNILIQITRLRNVNLNSLSMEAKIEFSDKLDQLAKAIENQTNRNVDWKAEIINHHLPKEIEKVEHEVLSSSEKYNNHVTLYNEFLQNRRTSLIANKMGLSSKNLFEPSALKNGDEKIDLK